jgi:hypothetical protein
VCDLDVHWSQGLHRVGLSGARLEFTGLLFIDEIFDNFNHSSNIRVRSDQLSFVIYRRPTSDPVSHAQRATYKEIRYPSLLKLLFLLCPECDWSLVPTRS